MNPFGRLGRVVAMALSLVIFAPVADIATAQVPSGEIPSVSRAVPTNTVYPAITGTARVPNTLTASRGTWGNAPTTFTNAWYRCTTAAAKATAKPASCTLVDGQTAATYVLSTADAGKFVVASVTAGNTSGSLTRWSASTVAIVAQYLPPANTVAPALTGNKAVSQILTVSNGTWTETPSSYAYKWFRCTATQVAANAKPAACTEIGGQTNATYTLVTADAARFIVASVTATNTVSSVTKWSASTTAVAALPAPVNTVAPALSGSAQVSRIVSLTDGTWTYRPTSYTYKWYSCTATKAAGTTLPAGCTQIVGATASTYQLLARQKAKFVLGMVKATNRVGSTVRYTATTTAVKVPAPYSPSVFDRAVPDIRYEGEATPEPASAISGDAKLGSVLVASKGVWLGYPLPEVSYSYWYRCDLEHLAASTSRPSDCYAIAGSNGASGETYLIVEEDVGHFLAFEVIATNNRGTSRYFTPTTDAVSATPTLIAAPTVTGSPGYGETLSTSQGRWSVAPGLALNYSYSWRRCATSTPNLFAGIPVGCETISGANGSTHLVTINDLGSYLVATVAVTNGYQETVSASSLATQLVRSIPTNLSVPEVEGSRGPSGVLSVQTGTWVAYPAATTTVQWYRCANAAYSPETFLQNSCSIISGETSIDYSLTAIDKGKFVTAAVTVRNALGAATSWAGVYDYQATKFAPELVSPPIVSGTLTVGTDAVISSSGAWNADPWPFGALKQLWFTCDTADSGFEDVGGPRADPPFNCVLQGNGYNDRRTIHRLMVGKFLFLAMTLRNEWGSKTAVVSVGIPRSAPTLVTAHVVGGVSAVGETLNATSGSWVVYPENTSYQWYRCTSAVTSHQLVKPAQCDALPGDTDHNYLLNDADYGKFLSVSMTKSNELGTLTVWSRTAGAVGTKPESVTSPTLDGSPEVGQSLTISSGQWTGDPDPDLSFAMYACDGPITSQDAIETPGCQQFFGPAVTSLSLGTDNSCFSNDDGNVVCWGPNQFGEVGDGTTVTRRAAVRAGVQSVKQVSVGETHTCALLLGGQVDCWGLIQGDLRGNGTVSYSGSDPNRVFNVSNAIQIASGLHHSCALRIDGTVSCWGARVWLGGSGFTTGAEQVPGIENAIQISHSMRHACAVLADGTVKCWGYNAKGQIGDGTNQTRVTPVFVSGINNATAVSTGENNTCALLADGTVKCWGDNWGYQLGLNANADGSNIPVILGGISSAVQISTNDRSACALISDGSIKCVGDNDFGALGNGAHGPASATPSNVVGINNAVSIAQNSHRGCALLETNEIKCWGYSGDPGSIGRIGDGTQFDRYSPVSIRFDLSTDVIFPIPQQLEGKWLIAGVRGASKYGTSSDSWSNPIGPIGPTH